jgi:hypothetical protein
MYSTGTIALTNGGTTVTGTGTAWVGTLRQGWLLLIPGEGPLLVASVVSNTSLTIARAYQGSSRSGQVYNAVATRGELQTLNEQLQDLLDTAQDTIDNAGQGRFAAGTAASPSLRGIADGDTGWNFLGSNQLEMIVGGVRRLLATTSALSLASMNIELTGGGASTSFIRRIGGSRHELCVTAAASPPFSTGSRGSAMQMYGNLDPEHPGALVFSTGPNDAASARIFLCQNGTLVLGAEGAALWDYADDLNTGTTTLPGTVVIKDNFTIGSDRAGVFVHKRYQSTSGTEVTLPSLFGGVLMEEGNQDLGPGDGARFGFFVRPNGTLLTLEKAWFGFMKTTQPEEEWAHDFVLALAADQTRESIPTPLLRARAIERDLLIQGHRAVTLGNLVGAVGQSGGAPTGAVVEHGSNANGRFTRFADGTQFCFGGLDITPVANTPTSAPWTFPAAFVSSTTANLSILVTQNSAVPGSTVQEVSFASPTTTGADIFVYRTNTTSTNIRCMAIGRWF